MLLDLLNKSPLAPYISAPRIGSVVLAVSVVFGAGWTVQGWRKDRAILELENAHQRAVIDAEEEATARWASVLARYAAADVKHYQEMTDAQANNDRLRADVAAGRKRLLVRAVCPGSAQVPGASAAPGVGDATAAELRGDSVAAYHDLTDAIATVKAQLLWFQDAARK